MVGEYMTCCRYCNSLALLTVSSCNTHCVPKLTVFSFYLFFVARLLPHVYRLCYRPLWVTTEWYDFLLVFYCVRAVLQTSMSEYWSADEASQRLTWPVLSPIHNSLPCSDSEHALLVSCRHTDTIVLVTHCHTTILQTATTGHFIFCWEQSLKL